MEFITTSILLPMFITIFIGTPLSIYAGVIATRFILFGEIKNKCCETIILNSGPYRNSVQIENCKNNLEVLRNNIIRLDNMGYYKASEELSNIFKSLNGELSDIHSSFMYSEVRAKTSPTKINLSINESLEDILKLKPDLRVLLKISLNVF